MCVCVCFLTLGWTALSHSIFGLDSPQPFKIVALRSGLGPQAGKG